MAHSREENTHWSGSQIDIIVVEKKEVKVDKRFELSGLIAHKEITFEVSRNHLNYIQAGRYDTTNSI